MIRTVEGRLFGSFTSVGRPTNGNRRSAVDMLDLPESSLIWRAAIELQRTIPMLTGAAGSKIYPGNQTLAMKQNTAKGEVTHLPFSDVEGHFYLVVCEGKCVTIHDLSRGKQP